MLEDASVQVLMPDGSRIAVRGWDDGSVWLSIDQCSCGRRHAGDEREVRHVGETAVACAHCGRRYVLQLDIQAVRAVTETLPAPAAAVPPPKHAEQEQQP